VGKVHRLVTRAGLIQLVMERRTGGSNVLLTASTWKAWSLMPRITHRDLVAFADEKVNLKKSEVDDQRAQVNRLRDRIETKIGASPSYGVRKGPACRVRGQGHGLAERQRSRSRRLREGRAGTEEPPHSMRNAASSFNAASPTRRCTPK